MRRVPPQLSANAAAVLIGVLAAMLLFAAFEGVFYALNQSRVRSVDSVQRTLPKEFYARFPRLGWRAPGARVYRDTLTRNGTVIFDVEYTLDGQSCRVTPDQDGKGRNRFLLFFGCSFTFGEGVEDGETLPAQAARRARDFRAYNFAYSGYGPQHALAMLEDWDFRGLIGESRGAMIYVFIPDHIRRAIGSMRLAAGWSRTAPCYEYDESGALVSFGNFRWAHPWRYRVQSLAAREQFLKYRGVDWPPAITEAHAAFTADILKAAGARFQEQFGGCPVRVLLYPDFYREISRPAVKAILEARGLEVIDLSGLFRPEPEETLIPHNFHPNARSHERVAEALVTSESWARLFAELE